MSDKVATTPLNNLPAMSPRNWALLVLLSLLWGATFIAARVAVVEVHPLLLVFYRVALAASAVAAWAWMRGISLKPAVAQARWFLLLGLVNNVIPFSLIFIGQTELGAGPASILNATTPFWAIIMASIFLRDERITLARIVGVILGIAGTAVMIGPVAANAIEGPLWPKLAILGSALSYGIAAILARRMSALGPLVATTGQLVASTCIMAPVALFVVAIDGLNPVSGVTVVSILMLGLVSTAFAYILYFSIAAQAGATNVSLVTLLVPVSAILLGVVLLGETISLHEIAGMGIIALGLIVIDGRLLRAGRTR